MSLTNPKLSSLIDRFNATDPKFLAEFRTVLRSYSVTELGRMTIGFLDFQHLLQSTLAGPSVRVALESADEQDPSVLICERESSDYTFTEWPPMEGFITGKALFEKIKPLLSEVK